jgi:hypothetical protein
MRQHFPAELSIDAICLKSTGIQFNNQLTNL